jgi:hypothetical protein
MREIKIRGYPKYGERGTRNHHHRNGNFDCFFNKIRFHPFLSSVRMNSVIKFLTSLLEGYNNKSIFSTTLKHLVKREGR